jgi:hypothetical protein
MGEPAEIEEPLSRGDDLDDLLSVFELKEGANQSDLDIPAFIRRQMN